jgi:hypothetical protein
MKIHYRPEYLHSVKTDLDRVLVPVFCNRKKGWVEDTVEHIKYIANSCA